VSVDLKVYQNSDDALLVWDVEEKIDRCVGFAVRRELTSAGKTKASWLDNYAGFRGEKANKGETRPSTEWPFQGFSWTDHGINQGDTARYRVTPVMREEDGSLKRLDSRRSAWASGREPSSTYRAFFNRGYVMSQFVARYLEETKQSLSQFKDTISEEDEQTIRVFLSGEIRTQLLALLAQARESGGEVHAALFELGDDELIDALVPLSGRAHVVLANGSIEQREHETAATARKRDGNARSRARLLAAGVDVEEKNRFVSPGPLAHNKFAVFTDKKGKAKKVWTGSTNWTPTGLCTQLNNALLIEDDAVAKTYMEQWKRLREAGSEFPKTLVDSNSVPTPDNVETTTWFTRTRSKVDLATLKEAVLGAEQGLLFLMFQPGGTGVLADVEELRKQKPELFVRGVVSELPEGQNDESVARVTFIGHQEEPESHTLDVIEPEGRPQAIAWWAAEATHNDVRANIGYAIVHSKILVIDPLSEQPTLITGSHNFSTNASTKNDENFLVLKGDRALAEAYLVNVFGAWRHYRARVASGSPFQGLRSDDSWMVGSLRDRQRQTSFWGF
jgi:phosphatidylserine/phosphatidylglycerophosphate/cardiolipin synthase-like enzyme